MKTDDGLEIILEVKEQSMRVDLALLEAIQKQNPLISRATLKTWFKQGQVLYSRSVVKGSFVLSPGIHKVVIAREELVPSAQALASPSTQGSFLPVIYEDENILVLNKTTGIPSVPHESLETETAVGSALAHTPSLSNLGKGGLEPGLLHRLDTGTSGLLVFAKTQEEYDRLRHAWRERQVQKVYRALVNALNPLPTLPLRIDFQLAHDAKSAKKMIALNDRTQRKIRGKPLQAITRILSASAVRSHHFDVDLSDMEIQIETGVMHQIRCHLAEMGWPILGDSIYNGSSSHRLWLHAWKLKLPLRTGTWLSLQTQLPQGWPKRT